MTLQDFDLVIDAFMVVLDEWEEYKLLYGNIKNDSLTYLDMKDRHRRSYFIVSSLYSILEEKTYPTINGLLKHHSKLDSGLLRKIQQGMKKRLKSIFDIRNKNYIHNQPYPNKLKSIPLKEMDEYLQYVCNKLQFMIKWVYNKNVNLTISQNLDYPKKRKYKAHIGVTYKIV